MKQLDQILLDRTCKYGMFEESATRANSIFHAMVCNAPEIKNRNIKPIHTEALHMIAMKVSRLVNGGINDADGWLDIAGYAMLVFQHLSDTNENNQNNMDEPSGETIKFMEQELTSKMSAYGGLL